MVFGNESPVAGIGRFIPIVAQHHVIIHFESIRVGFFSIDIYFAVSDLQVVMFVVPYGAFVNGQVFEGQFQSGSFLGIHTGP